MLLKRFLIIFILLLLNVNLFAQKIIEGIVLSEKNEPLEDVAVYFNNTTIGTVTDEKGEFSIKIPSKNSTLVFSYLGYTTQQIQLKEGEKISKITVKLVPNTNFLDEVVIRKIKYDDDWRYNLGRFKVAFLGRTKFASQCIIENEKDLFFDYDYRTKTLKAYAKKPLKIINKALGYEIQYDLIDFTIADRQLFYSGYSRYKNLKRKIKRKWKRNRLEAFNGSKMHFFRSALTNNLKEEGFIIHKVKRVKNENRPTDAQIKRAREILRLSGGVIVINLNKEEPKTVLDSAQVIIQKSRLPKFREYLVKKNVPIKDFIVNENEKTYLKFNDFLRIIYTKEPEEDNYLVGLFRKKPKTGVQTSQIVMLVNEVIVKSEGVLQNPTAVLSNGYWAFESFANMLPLDYQPKK